MTASSEHAILDMTGITAVEVATFGADLSVVTGAERPRLEATVYGNAAWTMERVGALLYIVGRKRGFFYHGNGVGFRLWLPTQLALKLANVSANIRVRGDMRSLTANIVHGDIEARASNTDAMRLRAVHGRILVHGVTSAFDIAATPGDVRMANSGGVFNITTTPGNVRLEQVMFAPGSHTITASPGAIEIVGVQAPGGLDLTGDSTHPPISVDMPGYNLRRTGRNLRHLRTHRPGPKPARLTLHAVGKLSVKE